MTSGSLFFKLLREDMKRRIWAIALLLLAFFFAMPVDLSLSMENAAKNNFYRYNNFTPLVQDGSIPQQEFAARLLRAKTNIVLEQAKFGNGLLMVLIIGAAVVMGVTGFSYLHNRKKIDFYHSIPVRREMLFAVQFLDGILLTAGAYLFNSLVMLMIAASYGVPLFAGAAAAGGGSMQPVILAAAVSFVLNMLYYILMYTVVSIAMMMTGNLVVGVLGTAVFFFFPPAMMMILAGYCDTFFVTSADYIWHSRLSPLEWGVKYLSPFSAYLEASTWNLQKPEEYMLVLAITLLVLPVLIVLSLLLYRKRPSEAAGKAMAFKWSMMPIRVILVLGIGLAGGIFFWALQSSLKWGIFGVMAAVIITHCIVEIIYHFDFKKLFSHKRQLVLTLAAGILVFLSFRYDWYGYDRYMPDQSDISSVSMYMDIDDRLGGPELTVERVDGEFVTCYQSDDDQAEENMYLTDLDAAMKIIEKGRDRVLAEREKRLGAESEAAVLEAAYSQKEEAAVSIIGGADGPTAIFLAGKTEDGEEEEIPESYYTSLKVCYRLTSGKKVKRQYDLYLSSVMDAYSQLYGQKQYKEGLYEIFRKEPESIKQVYYREGNILQGLVEEKSAVSELLAAYQKDFLELSVEQRLRESPVGSVGFVSEDLYEYRKQRKEMNGFEGYWQETEDMQYGWRAFARNDVRYWPVYPSFSGTIALLKKQGICPGEYLTAEEVGNVQVYTDGNLRAAENPHYTEDGYLIFEDPEEIAALMEAAVDEESASMNGLYPANNQCISCIIVDKKGGSRGGYLCVDKMTQKVIKMLEGCL